MAVLTIGAVGSPWFSRVAGLAASRSASFLDNSCFYGNVLSSAEAVQMVASGIGVRNIPLALAPLLAGADGLVNEPVFDLPHDRVFVEVSGRKVYTLDGTHINPMLLRRFFSGFPRLAEAALRQWPDAELRRVHLDALAQEAEMEGITEDEIWILNNISITSQSDDDIMMDFRRLHAMIGDRMVIVAPANLRNLEEGVADKFIRLLNRAARQLGLPFVDANALAATTFKRSSVMDTAEPQFQGHFELVLANELVRRFVEPAKQLLANTLNANSLKRERPRRSLKLLRRRTTLRPIPPSAAQDPAIFKYAAASSAWMAQWAEAKAAVELATAAGDDSPETVRLKFRTAWYSNDLAEALAGFARHVAQGQCVPAELLEGAEAAFQLGRSEDALLWLNAAVRAEPAFVEAAFKLAQIHGAEAFCLGLLEIAAAAGEPLGELIHQLERGSLLKREIAQGMLKRWSGEQVEAKVEGLLLLALRSFDAENNIDRAREIFSWCKSLNSAEQAKPLAARALTRALTAAMSTLDPERDPEELEKVARELAELDATNVRAVTYLAQRREAEGELQVAAELVESIGSHYLGSIGIQVRRVGQWLKAADFNHANAALLEAEAAHPNNSALARLRKRLPAEHKQGMCKTEVTGLS